MKVKDILKFAFWDFKKNLGKHLIAIVEIAMISFISIILVIEAVTFTKNSSEILKDYYTNNQNQTRTDELMMGFGINTSCLNQKICDDFLKMVEPYRDIISTVAFDPYNSDSILFTDFSYLDFLSIETVQTDNLEGLPEIYLSESFVSAYEEENNVVVEKGEPVTITIELYKKEVTANFIVLGIYPLQKCDYEMIINYQDYFSLFEDGHFMDIAMMPRLNQRNFDQQVKRLDELHQKSHDLVYNYFKQYVNSFDNIDDAKYCQFNYYCDFLDEYHRTHSINTIIMAIAIFIAIVLVLIGVVCITTTTNIIIDDNHYLMNIYKAYGMKKRDFCLIFYFELVLIMIIGLIGGFICTLIFEKIFSNFVVFFLEQLYMDFISAINYQIQIFTPIWVLILIFFVFAISIFLIFGWRIKKRYQQPITFIKGAN